LTRLDAGVDIDDVPVHHLDSVIRELCAGVLLENSDGGLRGHKCVLVVACKVLDLGDSLLDGEVRVLAVQLLAVVDHGEEKHIVVLVFDVKLQLELVGGHRH